MKILSFDFGTSSLKAGFYFKDKIFFYTNKNYYLDKPLLSMKEVTERIKGEHHIEEADVIVVDSIFPAFKFLDEDYYPFDQSFYWYNSNLGETINEIEKTNFKIKYVLSYKDYLNFLLTSKISTDFITYSNFKKEPYLGKFIKEFPDALGPAEPLGFLNEGAKEYLGIKGSCIILSGTIDAFVSALGMGGVDVGEGGEIGGSTTCVYKIIEKNSSELPYFFQDQSIKILAMSCGGITLKWLKDTFGLNEEGIFEKIDGNQKKDEKLLFFPYLLGARSPLWLPEIRAIFYGIDISTDFSDLLKAVVEGVAFVNRQNIDTLNLDKTSISIAGQTAASNSWNQIKSNIYNLSLRRVNYLQSAVVGSIFLGIKFLSNFKDHELKDFIKSIIKIEALFEPQEDKKLFYERKYKNFIGVQNRLYELEDLEKI
ncbi:MAG TPA: hypothetical protein DEG96_07430 [Candidatus Atribacteria bacterium]|uniref:D-xylulose kinase XylB n=1 Tax=candidate division TA06 bacterium 34_109 TaxID=1635277 RepID=A0A101I012_UNCT6|nr:MAG: D-xylulose kinase XylB [candidate division TA06 bacterium 34_109]HBY57670.1 hypothetical protein [Candidatus Atribacteria bacterium]